MELALVASSVLLAAACDPGARDTSTPRDGGGTEGLATTTTPGQLEDAGAEILPVAQRFASSIGPALDIGAVAMLAAHGDERWAWLLADGLRFYVSDSPEAESLTAAIEDLAGITVDRTSPWVDATNRLISLDIAAPPGYGELKSRLFAAIDERWAPLFAGGEVAMDLRYVSWGGVFIDDRELGDSSPCLRGCIPALDLPEVTDAAGGSWYPDDRIVFGVVVDGNARAYPKNLMETHEMVNDVLADRRIAVPYCTLCGSAQAYFTDRVDGQEEPLVIRTSGLLHRSNKIMYDLATGSMIDTFTGQAVSGPLLDGDVGLEEITVEVSRWGDWKAAHPDSTIVAADGGVGRTYADDPLGGRDDDGPIFPVGDVDARLPVQEPVLGVEAPDGTTLAFPAGAARLALAAGEDVIVGEVRVVTDGGGLRAETTDGRDLVSHESLWFAWSQFNPDTLVWGVDALAAGQVGRPVEPAGPADEGRPVRGS